MAQNTNICAILSLLPYFIAVKHEQKITPPNIRRCIIYILFYNNPLTYPITLAEEIAFSITSYKLTVLTKLANTVCDIEV